jgi:hypothetical protein
MAFFEGTALIGCSSIPSFIATGNRMVFNQSSAPTSWIKETNSAFNQRALRVIGGSDNTTLNPGGSSLFPSIFTNRSMNVALNNGPSNVSVSQATPPITISPSPSNLNVQPHAVDQFQLRTHSHPYTFRGAGAEQVGVRAAPIQRIYNVGEQFLDTNPGGLGNGSHVHGVSDSGHNHTLGAGTHGHSLTDNGHGHTFSTTSRNFSLTYVDVIICSKN